MRRLILALAALGALAVAAPAVAQEGERAPDHRFSFDGPFGNYDMASVQRGFAVYKQVCASCHSMNYLYYRHLGEEGGPFSAYWVHDPATGQRVIRQIPGPPEHGGELADISDNPFVRAIADDVQVTDIDSETGQPYERPGRPSDRFKAPFPNEAAARNAYGGAYPPDLTLITSARHGGPDYIKALLTGYTGATEGALHVNRYFPGGLIAMPPPLTAGALTYDDGTEATVDQMATDVATFLQWSADPHMEARKRLGFQVIAFLLVLAGLLYLSYKAVWRGESH